MKLTLEEENNYRGGSISSSMINAFTSLVKIIYTIGQNFGSTIKRIITNSSC